MEKYDHQRIEKFWQEKWTKQKLYVTQDEKPNAENHYTLVEFAYPSGDLHVGHWYAFSVTDIYARQQRMSGKNVMFPMGFDAFGLPAENAAIKRNVNPRVWTYENIERMKGQLASMGASFDWSREVITCNPEYYRWTQWLFIQLFNSGLAYRDKGQVNWCPSCKTVLANEQVVAGHCERCDSDVELREMEEWKLRITDYADRLIDDLEKLPWPESIKEAQRQWIGRSEGAEIKFQLTSNSQQLTTIGVFTTRPDTLFGATYLVLSPEHKEIPNIKDHISNWSDVENYITAAKRKTEMDRIAEGREKTGVSLEGITAINPATQEEIPVWVADYVIARYGTGAIMAVPAHDARDYEFAEKFDLLIREVVRRDTALPHTGEGVLINSEQFDGMKNEEAKNAITEAVGGKITKTYRLRDWGISRQRYWGCPIPIIYCRKCGTVPVSEKDLPVELPHIDDFMPRDDGHSPLAKVERFVNTVCPKCGGDAERETDTLDTFIDSSWYFLRYTDPKNDSNFASREKQGLWMPVSLYSGGAEHTTLHLLYSRFFHKALFDLGLVTTEEPFHMRRNRGIILGPDGQKMSKSRGNVINPDDYVEKLGADTVRMYLAFIGPYNVVGAYPWDPKSIQGVRRFLDRVWRLTNNLQQTTNDNVERELHKAIKRVTESILDFKFNTGVAALMEFLNAAEAGGITKEQCAVFVQLLAPFAPHISEELWQGSLGHTRSVHSEGWPVYDEAELVSETATLAVSVNGKVRAEIEVQSDATHDTVEKAALAHPQVYKWLGGKAPKKIVYVPGRIVNIVVD